MTKKTFLFLVMAFLCLVCQSQGEEKIEADLTTIKADHLFYDKERVFAKGHVQLTYGDTRILSDAITYDPKTGLLESAGQVMMERDGERMTGSHFWYNVVTRKGAFSLISGRTKNIYLEGQPIRGEMYYKGKSINIDNNVLLFKEVDLSTCDFPWDKKHYHIQAQEIKVIPGDKMVISHGRLWIGKTPLWHVAKLVIDLHPRPAHRQSYVPHFGYNKIDGFFVKTATNYEAFKDNYGTVLADYYQKTGFATGLEHSFPLGNRGDTHFSVYHQNGRGFQNFTREQLAASTQYDFGGGLKLSARGNLYRYRVPPIISPDTFGTQASLTKQSKHYSWSLTEFNNTTSGFSNSQVIQYHHLQDFGNNFHLDLSEDYYKTVQGLTTSSTFHNLTAFTKKFDGWSADLFYEKTDTGLFRGGFIDRTPEITLRTDNAKIKPLKLPYQASMSFGNYFESFRNLTANRWDFQFNVPQYTQDLSKNFHVTTSALYRQDFYDTGAFYPTRSFHARYILGDQTQLSTNLGNHFSALIDYRSQSDIGFDPLIYDTVVPVRALSGEFSVYDKDIWKLNMGTSYDYRNRFYQQLVTRLDLHPRKEWFFHLDSNYDPNFRKWQNLIAQADFRPFHDIRVQYWSSFSLQNGQVGYQDIALYKEWHDWEGRLVYRWHQQEVFLFFNLKAFPEQQVQLGINPILNTDPAYGLFELQ